MLHDLNELIGWPIERLTRGCYGELSGLIMATWFFAAMVLVLSCLVDMGLQDVIENGAVGAFYVCLGLMPFMYVVVIVGAIPGRLCCWALGVIK